jgi:hypothetical protein
MLPRSVRSPESGVRGIIVVGLLMLVAAGGALAIAAPGRKVLHNSQTRTLAAGTTKTFEIVYPDALKYGGSTYSGKVQILPPARRAHGRRPSLRKVRIRSRGSCVGGSEFCARVRNSNPRGTAPVRVRITATTILPPGKQP